LTLKSYFFELFTAVPNANSNMHLNVHNSLRLNVARMAKLSSELINKAKIKSKELEQILERRVKQRQLDKLEQSQGLPTGLFGRLEQILECKTENQASQLIQDIVASSRT
jgi:DNA mismatch repair protein MSH3